MKKNLHSDHGRKARAMHMQDRMPIDGNGPAGIPGNLPQPPQVSQQSSASGKPKTFGSNQPVVPSHGMENMYQSNELPSETPYQNYGI